MTVVEEAQALVDSPGFRAALPDCPKIVRIKIEPSAAWSGEEAMRVEIWLDDATTDEEFASPQGLAIRRTVRRELLDLTRRLGSPLWPYTRIGRQRDWEAPVEDAE